MRNELTHSGIKGMKWGIRKKYNKKNAERDRRIVNRAQKSMNKQNLGDLSRNGHTIVGWNKMLGKDYALHAILGSAASVGIGIATTAVMRQYKTNEVFRSICNNIFGNNAKFVIGGAGYGATAVLGAVGAVSGKTALSGSIQNSKIKRGLAAKSRLREHGYD